MVSFPKSQANGFKVSLNAFVGGQKMGTPNLLLHSMKKINICIYVIVFIISNIMSSCITTTSYELRKSCDFNLHSRRNHAPLNFYRIGNQYYLECDVTYETINRNMYLGGPFGAKDIELPINMHRIVTEKYYFLLPTNAVEHLFRSKTDGIDANAEHYIAACDWDADNAVPVVSSLRYADIDIYVAYDGDYRNLFNPRNRNFTLKVPKYRPWDYWIKQPLSVLLFIGVDIPATLVSPIFIVPYYAIRGY